MDGWSGIFANNPVSICGDCGIGGLKFIATKVKLNIFIKNISENKTLLKISIVFPEYMPKSTCPQMECVSNGKIEAMLLNFLQSQK